MTLPRWIIKHGPLFFLAVCWLAQEAAYPADMMVARWRTFTARDWLGPQTSVRALHEDKAGRLWAGTAGGLLCYDGLGWRRFTPQNSKLPYPVVLSIAESQDGVLWIGTGRPGAGEEGGLCRLDPAGRWSVPEGPPRKKLGEVMSLLAARDGRLWVGTRRNGLFTYEPAKQQWTLIDGLQPGEGSAYEVTVLAESGQGIWAGTTGPAKCFPAAGQPRSFTRPESVSAMAHDRDGRLWLATRVGELYHISGGRPVRHPGLLPARIVEGAGEIFALYADVSGRLWLATAQGVSVYDPTAQSLRAWWTEANSGLPSSPVRCVLQKRDGSLWFGTDRGIGVCDFRSAGWQRFARRQGILINEKITAIARRSDGTLLMAGDRGVDTYHPTQNRWQSVRPDAGGWNDRIDQIAETGDGTVWFISPYQVFAWKGSRWRSYWAGPGGLTDASRSGMVQESIGLAWGQAVQGKLWLGAQTGGIFSYDPATRRWERLPFSDAREMRSAFVRTALRCKDGSWWFAAVLPGPVGALLRYDPASGKWNTHTRQSIRPERTQGIPFDPDWTPTGPLYESPDGTLWAGARDGLLRYDGHIWRFVAVSAGPDGKRAGEIRAIAADSEGRLWVGTEEGIVILRGEESQHLTEEDGLPGQDIRAIRVAEGSVWIAGEGGVSRFRTEPVVPETYLADGRGEVLCAAPSRTRLYTSYESVPGRIAVILSRLRLWPVESADEAPLRVESTFQLRAFAANPWYTEEPDSFWHSWQIDNAPWTPESKDPFYTFRNIAGGAHSIRVRARNRWLNVDATPAERRVQVGGARGPLWGAGILALLGWGLAGYLWRARRKGAKGRARG
ncbi:MAG: hypothetical protein IT210_12880 [Armatimonadetes bacterium]|nr:hypothetical protein [Armatimonadota bacterium]